MKSFQPTGNKKEYQREAHPFAEGGYAKVFKARVKSTGGVVVFKQPRTRSVDDVGRLKREIRIQESLQPNQHVMPVLDSADDYRWYVMPLAEGDALQLHDEYLKSDEQIAEMVRQVAAGLAAAHDQELVHRDITPRNILALDPLPKVRWVLADWGLVRRALGKTTQKLTKSGVQIGTEGFIAPEVLRDPHKEASPKSDVFSLGRVIAWAVMNEWPLAGGSLIPPGRFRQLVRLTTQNDPSRRPDLDQLLEILEEAFESPIDHLEEAAKLVSDAQAGKASAANKLWEMSLDRLEDGDLLVDHVARLPSANVKALVLKRDPTETASVLEALRVCMMEESEWNWGRRQYESLDSRVSWFLDVAQAAAKLGDLGLLEDASEALFSVDAKWQRYRLRHLTRAWLETLRGDTADAVARALRRSPDGVDWYMDEDWQPSGTTASSIRGALRTGGRPRT
jgi:serine/threonine protein kinase